MAKKLKNFAMGFGAMLLAVLLMPAGSWAAALSAEDAKLLKGGKKLFETHCGTCHEMNGDNDIRKRTEKIATVGLEAYITGQGRIFEHMPLFEGSAKDRRAIALYVTVDLNHRAPDDHWAVDVKPLPLAIPAFNAKTDQYVLLTWNTLGMKCITDCDSSFSFLPPGNAMGAVLIKRGPKPQMVSTGVEMAYAAPPDARNPSAHVEFWKYAPSILGKELPLNVTAAGKGPEGVMAYNEKSKIFEVAGLPVTPYVDGGVNPYPLFTVTAKDTATGKVLAQTQAVVPVGAEMGCRNCHGGPWRKNNTSGISEETARGILAVHDKRSGTTLLAQAQVGKPVLCQSCHPDPLLNAKGDPARLNLPAAMHGFHANYLSGRGEEVCSRCHPDSHTGVTRCLRDNHASKGIGCAKCHGMLEDHTIGLLKGELAQGKQRAGLFLRNLKTQVVASAEVIKARTPWVQEPDCLTCHSGKAKLNAAKVTAFNTWVEGGGQLYRNRKEDTGNVPCIGCHSSPHATYPATNAYGKDRDNVQPLQYMGFAGPIGAKQRCEVCHMQAMKNEPHHKAMRGR